MPAHGSRFVMNFSNKTQLAPFNHSLYNSIAANVVAAPKARVASNGGDFRAPMISRVHKAKAGCSACGKKVA